MDAEIRTLSKIFQGDVQFLVPIFQRPYVWGTEGPEFKSRQPDQ